MDHHTIQVYDREAEKTANFHRKLIPSALYSLITDFFPAQGKVLDVGCGSGRDTNWLHQQGYNVIGVDASKGMLQQARKHYNHNVFIQDALPDLKKLREAKFDGILCSAVLMHLPDVSIIPALKTMLHLLVTGGIFICSFRHSFSEGSREKGKLYTPIVLEVLNNHLRQSGTEILRTETIFEAKRGVQWFTLIAKK